MKKSSITTSSIFFYFNRPEYVSSPEAFLSYLGWSVINEIEPNRKNNKVTSDKKGYVYEKLRPTTSKIVTIEQTKPEKENYSKFLEILHDNVDSHNLCLDETRILSSLFNSLKGVQPKKARGQAAIPITPACLFYQNSIGMHAKKNPANIGEIFKQMYNMGSKDKIMINPSYQWLQALSNYLDTNIYSLIEQISREIVPIDKELIDRIQDIDINSGKHINNKDNTYPIWLRNAETPFKWFKNTWDAFCSNTHGWERVMPARRWVDWSSTILRTTIGFGFLWEASFYKKLFEMIINNQVTPRVAQERILNSDVLLKWDSPTVQPSLRNVNNSIKNVLRDGLAFKDILDAEILSFFEKNDIPSDFNKKIMSENGLSHFIKWARNNLDKNRLIRKSENYEMNITNTYETIMYALLCRNDYTDQADYYGLLKRRSNRFTVVEPGPEWVVTVASVLTGRPGGATTLKNIKQSLRMLGLNPSKDLLIFELENAGLTRSSHDADEAIIVKAGF